MREQSGLDAPCLSLLPRAVPLQDMDSTDVEVVLGLVAQVGDWLSSGQASPESTAAARIEVGQAKGASLERSQRRDTRSSMDAGAGGAVFAVGDGSFTDDTDSELEL